MFFLKIFLAPYARTTRYEEAFLPEGKKLPHYEEDFLPKLLKAKNGLIIIILHSN